MSESRVPHRFIDYEEAYGRPYEDIPRRCPDLSKLKRLTGFVPARPLEQIVANLLATLTVGA